MSPAEVARARAQMKAGMLMGLESPSTRAERIARLLAIWDRVPDLDETVARIDAVTTGDVKALASEMTGAGGAAMALYGPVDKAPDRRSPSGTPCGVMIWFRRRLRIETARLTLRPPAHADFRPWAALRRESADFLTPWEPAWARDHLTRKAFSNRVYWAQRTINGGTALPLFLERRSDGALLGAITLDNIRRGPSQAGTLGYWIGRRHIPAGLYA